MLKLRRYAVSFCSPTYSAHEFGLLYRARYAGLLDAHAEDEPGVFVRSSGSGRVVETAGHLINVSGSTCPAFPHQGDERYPHMPLL